MFAIVGAAGKVGYSTCLTLCEAGLPVRAILRDVQKAPKLREIGCEVMLADLRIADNLRRAIADVDAVQVILPPPPQADDALAEMRHAIESLADALEQARPDHVLAISDYGAHVDEWIGMPSAFRLMEERLRKVDVPCTFLRSAEQMEGWGAFFSLAMETGTLPSLHHPVRNPFPAVSASDVGVIAADLLQQKPTAAGQIVHVEGPKRYNAVDVATAMGQLLRREVTAQALPREQWHPALAQALSVSAAELLVDLYEAHNRGLVDVEPGGAMRKGSTDLIDALRPMLPAATAN